MESGAEVCKVSRVDFRVFSMRIACCLLAFAIASATASAASISLDRAALDGLRHLPVGGSFVVDALPDGAEIGRAHV